LSGWQNVQLQNTKNGEGADRPDRYNIVGEVELNNLEMAQIVADLMGKPLNYKLIPSASARPGYDRRYALNGSKLRDLGWKPPFNFTQGLGAELSSGLSITLGGLPKGRFTTSMFGGRMPSLTMKKEVVK
jgi:hypothetical protein